MVKQSATLRLGDDDEQRRATYMRPFALLRSALEVPADLPRRTTISKPRATRFDRIELVT